MAGQSAGHLSIHIDGLHARDVPFLFERQPKRTGVSVLAAAAIEILVAALVMVPSRQPSERTSRSLSEPPVAGIVWLAETGPGGGGGGGGNEMPDSARQAELPGADALTVPVEQPKTFEPTSEPGDPAPIEPLIVPAQAIAAGHDVREGIIESGPPSLSQGPGSNAGGGTGSTGGSGPGDGQGLGPGFGFNTGGERPGPGSAVTLPVELIVPRPQYTAEAMRARIQGKVLLECVIQTSGICTNARVVRSLDPIFGLDQEAIRAAGLFRFRPAMLRGEPVPMLVRIELSFSLH